MTIDTIVVLAKEPVPGRVKTRLCPPFTPAQAAELAAAALRDTLATVARTPVRRRVLAFDGDTTRWTPKGWVSVGQPDGGLDGRISAAVRAGAGPTLLIGMDTPQVRPDHLMRFDPSRFDAALGLADDGGYWAIGLADPVHARAALDGIPMSTSETGERQLDRLNALGLRVQILDSLTDVDTVDDLDRVATAAPSTRFARTAATQCPGRVERAG